MWWNYGDSHLPECLKCCTLLQMYSILISLRPIFRLELVQLYRLMKWLPTVQASEGHSPVNLPSHVWVGMQSLWGLSQSQTHFASFAWASGAEGCWGGHCCCCCDHCCGSSKKRVLPGGCSLKGAAAEEILLPFLGYFAASSFLVLLVYKRPKQWQKKGSTWQQLLVRGSCWAEPSSSN